MRIIAILLSLLFAALLAAALTLRSQTTVLAAIDWALDRYTGFRLEVREPLIDIYRGTFSAQELHLIPKGIEGPPLLSVLGLSGSTKLGDLVSTNLAHSELYAAQVTIYVAEGDAAEDPAPMEWLQYLGWLPDNLEIDQLHVITAAETTFVFPLKALRGARTGARQYRVSADADYEGEPLEMTFDLLALRAEERLAGLSLTGQLHAPESGSQVLLEGELKGTDRDFTYDLALDANYQDVGAFFKGFQLERKVEGKLTLRAKMHGDTSGFVLSDAVFLLDNMPQYGFEAAGRLEHVRGAESRVSLTAAGDLSSLDYLVGWLGPTVGDLGRAQASLTLSGSLGRPVLDKFVLHTESGDGLAVSVSGRWEPPPAAGAASAIHNEIWVDASGPSLRVLERWLEPLPVDLGGWYASGQLTGGMGHISVNDLILEMGDANATLVKITGDIDNIAATAEQGLGGVEGIHLEVATTVANSAALGELLKRDVPPGHHGSARFQLQGDGHEVHALNGDVTLSAEGVNASLSSAEAVLYPAAASPLTALTGRVSIALADTAVAATYVTSELPSLGPLSASGDLALIEGRFQLSSVAAELKTAGLTADATGRVGNLADFSGVAMKTRFAGVDIRGLIRRWQDDFQYEGQLGQLGGRFEIGNSDGIWRITRLEVDNTEASGALDLSATGTLDDLAGPMTADLSGSYQIRDPALLEALTGLRMNPAAGSLVVKRAPPATSIASQLRIGDTQLEANAGVFYDDDDISRVELAVSIPHLYLRDLGLQAGQSETDGYKPIERLEPEPTQGALERMLGRLPRFETDIRLDIDGITGDKTNINSAHVHLTGENNRHTLRRFSLTYARSDAEVRGIIDLNPDPPALSLAGRALLVPLDTLAADLGVEVDIKGTLTMQGGITASGKTPDALLKTLDGSVALALEDAVIEGAAYDVLATDFLEWIYSGAIMEKYTDIECTMARFQLDDGVATSDSLYIETDKMLATGKGKFDLVAKKVDVTVTPLSKSRVLQVPSSVRIKGSFANPRPIISPITAAADASAQVLTALPQMAMKLFGISQDSTGQRRPCVAE